jgi:hypothetical protein
LAQRSSIAPGGLGEWDALGKVDRDIPNIDRNIPIAILGLLKRGLERVIIENACNLEQIGPLAI